MAEPGDITLATYEIAAPRYRDQSAPAGQSLLAFLDRVAQLVRSGEVLELGSGPGREARYLERRGLRVEQSAVGSATTVFADIGALAWYLSNVKWAVRDFSIDRHRDALLRLQGSPIRVASERFWIEARA